MSKRADGVLPVRNRWALGGYTDYPKVPNLAPTHRRFIAENAAYALLRVAPVVFITCMPIHCICVFSYLIEGCGEPRH